MSRLCIIPENFKQEYMKFYAGEVTLDELRGKFGVSRTTLKNWRAKLSLPLTRPGAGRKISIPENFRDEYMRYCRGKQSLKELACKIGVSVCTCRRWGEELNLPMSKNLFIKDYTDYCTNKISAEKFRKKYKISRKTLNEWKAEDGTSKNTKGSKPFTFKLLGYEISIKVKKSRTKTAGTSSSNFNDFIEY